MGGWVLNSASANGGGAAAAVNERLDPYRGHFHFHFHQGKGPRWTVAVGGPVRNAINGRGLLFVTTHLAAGAAAKAPLCLLRALAVICTWQ